MNKVFLIGNLTRDPDLSETNSGVKVCRFSIAVNRSYLSAEGERETDFFNVTAWRGTGETVAKYCRKGQKVAVLGSIQMRTYEDNQGVKRTAVDIIAQDVEFLGSKGHEESPANNETENGERGAKPQLQAFDDDGDIPF